MRRLFVCLLFLAVSSFAEQAGSITVRDLKCEYKVCPVGIGVQRPVLSWTMQSPVRGDVQTAYQVIVAEKPGLLNDGWMSGCKPDLWNSGKVVSDRSVGILYGGKSLESGKRVWWKVRVWDRNDKPGAYSESAWWEMALLSAEDWKGKWICENKQLPQKEEELYDEFPAPLLRKDFKVDRKVKRARAYISGLGYYELSINGARVGDQVLDPGWTSYGKRVLYSTYDVTDLIRRGDNAVGVVLGNGWYNPLPLRMWGHLNIREHLELGRPRCILQLNIEYADGSAVQVVSDESWRTAEGPILKNSIYLGEVYDARREIKGWDEPGFDDSAWRSASVSTEPIGVLQAQPQPPVRVTETFNAVKVTEPQTGMFVYDMGQNFSGLASFQFEAPAGTRISVRYGELLQTNGMLNPMTSVGGQIKGKRKNKDGVEENKGGPGSPVTAWQGDIYVTRGGGKEIYTPRFTFHGFRYLEITGLPEALPLKAVTGLRLNSDVAGAGSFACSNEQFNRIQEMCRRTFLANIFSVQSDCPHRERFGYGGDIVATSEALMLNYDMSTFYAKAVQDWADAARPDGMFTDTAPFVGIQYCGVGWAMAHPLLVMQLYRYYGNERIVWEQYEAAKRWFLLVSAQNEDGIIKNGLSDHEGLVPAPSPPMVTPLFYQSARLLADMARVLNRQGDVKQFELLAEKSRLAYQEKFIDAATGKAGPGTQASQSFALYSGLVPEQVRPMAVDYLLENIRGERKGHLSTGIMGTKFMLDVLSREGRAGTACGIVNQADFPGWIWMLENGATTLWEHWAFSDNTFSHSHPMFGSVSQWFMNWLGGIQPAPDAVGFDHVVIRPQFVDDIDWVKSSYDSVRGKIVSSWLREKGRLRLEVELPVNVSAELWLPVEEQGDITENGGKVSESAGVKFIRSESGSSIFSIGSGRYVFEIDEGGI